MTLKPGTIEILKSIRYGSEDLAARRTRRQVLAGIALAALAAATPGCAVALGGATVKEEIIFVEPGAAVEIATDKPVKCRAVDEKGAEALAEKNLAGFMALPKSVYQKYLDCWNKSHQVGV